MPLHDHFSPPLSRDRHWEGFHSAWANEIVRQLNHVLLPDRYLAEPHIRLGTQVEIDVATLEETATSQADNGGAIVATYAPPKPTLVFKADWRGQDTFEIQVKKEDGGLRLVAAIELVSPSNKDRPSNRAAFVRKCASYLQQGVALIAIDIVTQRAGDLHADLVAALGLKDIVDPNPRQLFAAAYRTRPLSSETQVETWRHSLALGDELPELPLWLDVDLAIPLNLEESYQAACETLRITE